MNKPRQLRMMVLYNKLKSLDHLIHHQVDHQVLIQQIGRIKLLTNWIASSSGSVSNVKLQNVYDANRILH